MWLWRRRRRWSTGGIRSCCVLTTPLVRTGMRRLLPFLRGGAPLAVAAGCLLFASLLLTIQVRRIFRTPRARMPLFPQENETFRAVCDESAFFEGESGRGIDTPPTIYFITPTHTRREQVAELTRLANTLRQVSHLAWVVAEDSARCSPAVARLMARVGVRRWAHLAAPMPEIYLTNDGSQRPRGVAARNAGMDFVLDRTEEGDGAVIYFGDDDNSYDLELFDEIRKTKNVSMFPVGLIGKQGFSSPILKEGRVVGFTDWWISRRRFPVDMAGFALGADLVRNSGGVRMPFKAGREETLFLSGLGVTAADVEPLADNCTRVLVWHTQSVREVKARVRMPTDDRRLVVSGGKSSLDALVADLESKGVINWFSEGDEDAAAREVRICMGEECEGGDGDEEQYWDED